MKSRYRVWFALVVCAGLLGHGAIAKAGGNGRIPLTAGQFSSTVQGSLAFCSESCHTSGALGIPLSVLIAGAYTQDNAGNSCATYTEVDSNLPVNASPPTVTANEHVVAKVVNYDATTGIGDGSFTTYTGGACNGSTFDSTGATELGSGTDHLVVSKHGNRIDYIFTSLTTPTDSIGDFSLSGTALIQTQP